MPLPLAIPPCHVNVSPKKGCLATIYPKKHWWGDEHNICKRMNSWLHKIRELKIKCIRETENCGKHNHSPINRYSYSLYSIWFVLYCIEFSQHFTEFGRYRVSTDPRSNTDGRWQCSVAATKDILRRLQRWFSACSSNACYVTWFWALRQVKVKKVTPILITVIVLNCLRNIKMSYFQDAMRVNWLSQVT